MGHLVVMDDSAAQFALTSYSRKLWHDLAEELPTDVEYEQCGTLWLAADEDEMLEVHRKRQSYADRGVRVEVLDGLAVAEAEPNLRAGMAGGLRVLDDAVLYPPCAARFLLEKAVRHGATVRTGVEVQALLTEGGVTLKGGSCISGGISVNATGPWSPELTPGLPVRKRKGHLVITDRYRGYVHHQIVELGYLKSAHSMGRDSVAFNIQPRKNGQMLLGSSRQFDAGDTTVEQPILNRMLLRACEYLPSLGGLSALRTWTGHRAATPDKLPVIGPSAAHPRIWLATGHEGLGITTSLATGRLLADLLLKRTSEIPPEPFSPARFATATNSATHERATHNSH
jgi:glycine/D-amino acid oxidase-like deaminating enzyme